MEGHKQKTSLLKRQVFKPSYCVKEQRMGTINLSVNPKILSHELRTPLTNILNLAKELSRQKRHLTPDQLTCIEGITTQGDRLLKVFNELLFSQYRKTAQNTSLVTVDVATVNEKKAKPIQPLSTLPILIADDEKLIRLVNRNTLEELGYQVDVAENGHEALAFFKSKCYAAILTDINMPMTGIELATEIRQLEANKSFTPIIALTADITEETKQECLAAGINEVLTKPIKTETLLTLLEVYLGG